MPKFLKFIFDLSNFLTVIYIIVGSIYVPSLLLVFLCNGLLRIPLMMTEYIFLRPYLVGKEIKKALFQMNYTSIVLMLLPFLIFIVQGVLAKEQIHSALSFGIGITITLLIGLCEVYIKANFIKKRNLTTNLREVVKRLLCIVVPFWLLFYIVAMLVIKIVAYFNTINT